jgi:hypothetical protein
VLERVDGLAQQAVAEWLTNAAAAANDAVRLAGPSQPELQAQWKAEADRLHTALDAARNLNHPRARVRTQVTTTNGRFVDLEVWLRPQRPADTASDVLVWVESKHGSDIHGTQLEAYLGDIEAQPGVHKVVLLLVPRRQELATNPPWRVPRVDWETVGGTAAELLQSGKLTPSQTWLPTEYAVYLREEGLMGPDALTASHAIALMEMDDADAAIAGICEHAEAWLRKNWGKPKDWRQVRGASTNHAFGCEYWASYRPHKGEGNEKAPGWLTGWFDWGVGYTSGWQYLDPGTVRGSVAFWAGAGFEAKAQPQKVAGNEEWLAQRLSDKFVASWFQDCYRLVRIEYPDELLVATAVEEQGRTLGEWIVKAFEALAADVPPHH